MKTANREKVWDLLLRIVDLNRKIYDIKTEEESPEVREKLLQSLDYLDKTEKSLKESLSLDSRGKL